MTARERVAALGEKWIKPIGLAWWKIDHLYYETNDSFIKDDTTEAIMRVTGDWRYRTAQIRVNLQAVTGQSDAELENGYIHELMHIFLLEMAMTATESDAQDHEERVAQTLADAFLWARNGGIRAE